MVGPIPDLNPIENLLAKLKKISVRTYNNKYQFIKALLEACNNIENKHLKSLVKKVKRRIAKVIENNRY